MSFSKRPGKNTPQCYTKPLDSLKNWNNRFFWVDERVFPTVVDWRTNAPKDGMPADGTYSVEAMRALDTHRTPLQKQPEMLLCVVEISRRYYLGDEVYPTFHYDDDREMDLFNLIRAPNPTKMDEPAVVTDSSGVPSTIERSLLDFAHEAGASDRGTAAPEMPSSQGIAAAGDPESENASSSAKVGSPGSVYRPKWGVTNGSLLDTPEACQDLVDHAAHPGYFSKLRHMHNEEFLGHTTGDRGRNEEGRVRQECWADQKIRRPLCLVLRSPSEQRAFVSAGCYSPGAEQRCTELDARLDALSIDFDEELYPHMLTAIAGRRWVIGYGLRLAMMKCVESLEMRQAFADVVSAGVAKGMSESLKHGVEHGQAQLKVESIEAYDPKAEAKFVAALQSLKDLKYPLLDQLEGLKDAPMDVIMAALYLESDTGGDTPQYIRDLRLNSSQLTIPVYPKVRDPRNPWAYKEEMKLSNAIAANVSRAEKKKKCRIVCRTHGVGSAYHARSDGVPVSVPTMVPQGLALLLVDAATQTDEDT
nr:transposase (putative), gypsy type [Tanacetum cinerariifolium]